MEHRDSGMLDLELCREIEERRLRRGFVERTRAAKGAAGPSQRRRRAIAIQPCADGCRENSLHKAQTNANCGGG